MVSGAMIRPATKADIPRMVEMGEHFRKESSYNDYLAKNPEKMATLAQTLIDADGVLLAERDGNVVGMIGYILHDHFISGEKFAGEVFWWVEPQYRGEGIKLMREAEKRARLAGAKHMQMIAPNEKVALVYERLDYEFVEATYQRSL
jgi:GNAT superfamily N-acetyltransferase